MSANNSILDGLAAIAESFEDCGRLDLATAVDKAAFLLGGNKQIVADRPFNEVVSSYTNTITDQVARLDSSHQRPFVTGVLRDIEAHLNQIHSDLQAIKGERDLVKRAAKFQALALLISNLADV